MKEIAEVIQKVKETSSRNEKIAILTSASNLPGLKEVLYFVFNPYHRTNIGAKKLEKTRTDIRLKGLVNYKDIINYFTEHVTGTNVDCRQAWCFINSFNSIVESDLVYAMITKTLKIGVTENTLNKVFGENFIPKIGVMLGSPYKDNKKVKGPFIVTEKLDGHRCIIVKDKGGQITCYSRSGKVIEGLVDITISAALLPSGHVYDGECLAKGDFKNSLELRQATNSIMLGKGIKRNLTFNIFDMIPVDEFVTGRSREIAADRKKRLAVLFGQAPIGTTKYRTLSAIVDNEFIKAVPILGIANTEEDIMRFAQKIWDKEFEGVMLNTVNGYYEIKRSKQLLKVKSVESYDLPIVGFQKGSGKYSDVLGAFVVEYKGHHVEVGSGLTDEERERYWDIQDELIGVKIEIDSFGETTNQNGGISLNCPIFKGIRRDLSCK